MIARCFFCSTARITLDQVHVDLIRRVFLGQAVQIDYNPLTADPDYLVVNRPFLMWWTLYDSVVKNGAFRPIQNYGRYRFMNGCV